MPSAVWYANGTEIKDNIKFTYDKCGNIAEVRENGALVARYAYDSLNRLIREDNRKLDKTCLYDYDNNGNITVRRETAFTLKSDVEECEFETFEYGYNGDRLVSYNGELCEYNGLGSPTKYRGKTATWKYGKLLTELDGTTFTYDGLGRRTRKGNVQFVYDSEGRLIKQSNGLEFIYDHSGITGFKYNGSQYFYRKDVQGNITAILDSTGNIVVRYNYDAWGNYSITGNEQLGNLNPFRYRGYYYDTETNLYYLQTRYYDPETGRFISQDSIEYADPESINGLNLYAYCGNNPVMGYDPTGTWNWGKFWAGVGRIALGVGAVVAGALVLASGVAGVAMIAVAVVTVGAGVATTVNGVADIGEAATDYNFMRDGVFGGDEEAYNTFSTVTDTVSMVGSMICGGWLKTNAPRIKAYKNMNSYNVKRKHLPSNNQNIHFNQFNTMDQNVLRELGKEAIKNTPMRALLPNSADSYILLYDAGRVISTKGLTTVKLVFSYAGKIITFYPF